MKDSHAKYDKALYGFPKKEMFRMFIDKKRQNEGEDAFDVDEPGYKSAMLQVLTHFIRDNIGTKLDGVFFILLHDLCVDHVTDRFGKQFEKGLSKASSTFYKIHLENVSEEAKKEWAEEKLIRTERNIGKGTDDDMKKDLAETKKYLSSLSFSGYLMYNSLDLYMENEIKDKITALFETYYQSLAAAMTDDAKLAAIARLCRALEIFHVFSDGNLRTISFALLNHLLIENNFTPAILDDPYVFDGYHSAKELVEDIKQGMKNFECYTKI